MSSKEIAKKRGPKTPAGKLAVSHNASKHGILSPRPVVMGFESEGAWKSHRQAILDGLAPEGGIELALAERVALCSWRLNRVAVYETERITAEQESVAEEVAAERKHKLKHASLYATEVKEMVAGTPLERPVREILDGGNELSDYAVEALGSPEAPFEALGHAKDHYETVGVLFEDEEAPEKGEDASAGAPTISRHEAVWVFEKAPYCAVEQAALAEELHHMPESEGAGDDEIAEAAAPIEDELWERVGDKKAFTVQELKDLLAWVAQRAGMHDEIGADGDVAYTSLGALLEILSAVAVSDLNKAAQRAKEVEEQLVEKRRARILPDTKELEKIGRYEAHLSRELYRALHELEALQARRSGGTAPLGRLDVQI